MALIGPEPVMAALDRGVDGVITGRALDIGLFMALPMLRGIPTAVAALRRQAARVRRPRAGARRLGPVSLGQSWTRPGFEVRSPSADARATVRSLVSHTFYERSHPTLEENPGGTPRPRRRDLRGDADRHPLRGCPLGRGARTPC